MKLLKEYNERVGYEVYIQIHSQVREQVYRQVFYQIWKKVFDRVIIQANRLVSNHIWDQFYETIKR